MFFVQDLFRPDVALCSRAPDGPAMLRPEVDMVARQVIVPQEHPRLARPLILVATPDEGFMEELLTLVRSHGHAACSARTAAGCLRVATAVGPDMVLLDARLPGSLERMLHTHPATAATRFIRLEANALALARGRS